MQMERRRYERFRLQSGVAVLHGSQIGGVDDISLGGMACSCLAVLGDCLDADALDIMCHGEGCSYRVRGVHFRVVRANLDTFLSTVPLARNRCALEFLEAAEMAADIQQIINDFSWSREA